MKNLPIPWLRGIRFHEWFKRVQGKWHSIQASPSSYLPFVPFVMFLDCAPQKWLAIGSMDARTLSTTICQLVQPMDASEVCIPIEECLFARLRIRMQGPRPSPRPLSRLFSTMHTARFKHACNRSTWMSLVIPTMHRPTWFVPSSAMGTSTRGVKHRVYEVRRPCST